MTTETIVQLAVVCGAILTIAAFVKFVVQPIWRLVRALTAFLEDWNGEAARPGRKAVPSMPERMATVEWQVTPNGGDSESLADRVIRIARFVGLES